MKILAILFILLVLPAISLALTIDCEDCVVDRCSCDTNCNGIMRVWKDSGCDGIWDYEYTVTKKSVVWEPSVAGTYYASIFDGKDYCVKCEDITVSSTAATTTTSTTILQKVDCPYECCEGMTGYKDKKCKTDEECISNKCVKKSGGSSWIIWVVLVLIIIGVIGFILLRKKEKRIITYQDLYRKWPRRPRR